MGTTAWVQRYPGGGWLQAEVEVATKEFPERKSRGCKPAGHGGASCIPNPVNGRSWAACALSHRAGGVKLRKAAGQGQRVGGGRPARARPSFCDSERPQRVQPGQTDAEPGGGRTA